MASWGFAREVIAPSLIPTKRGVQRKNDTRDATQLARLYRSGELTVVRVPTEAEERVRDLVRCRETFQREILKSRHYLLKTRFRLHRLGPRGEARAHHMLNHTPVHHLSNHAAHANAPNRPVSFRGSTSKDDLHWELAFARQPRGQRPPSMKGIT
jgi:hypothetical protein